MGPPACDPATWPAHQQPLLVVDHCDRGLQVVHGHLLSSLAVDVRDGQRPVNVRLSGDGHQVVAEVLQELQLGPTSNKRNVQKRTVLFATRICYVTEVGLLPYHS